MGSQLNYTDTIPPIPYWSDQDAVTLPSGPIVASSTSYIFNDVTLTEDAFIETPSGTAEDGQLLTIRFNRTDNNYNVSWDTLYMASSNISLPSTIGYNSTPATNYCFYATFRYNAQTGTWDIQSYTDSRIVLYSKIYTGPYTPPATNVVYGSNITVVGDASSVSIAVTGSSPQVSAFVNDSAATGVLDFSGVPSLNQIQTAFNGITSIILPQSSSLYAIQIAYVAITQLVVPTCPSLSYIQFYNLDNLTLLDLSGVSANFSNLGYYGGTNCPLLTTIIFPQITLTSLYAVWLPGCALSQTTVNNLCLALDANGQEYGTLILTGGTNAAPSGAAIQAVANLIAKNWTVDTN